MLAEPGAVAVSGGVNSTAAATRARNGRVMSTPRECVPRGTVTVVGHMLPTVTVRDPYAAIMSPM